MGHDPDATATVRHVDAETVALVASLVDRSATLEQFVLRESEVDALWSLADNAATAGDPGAPEMVARLWKAHEEIGHGAGPAAATTLRALSAWLAARPGDGH